MAEVGWFPNPRSMTIGALSAKMIARLVFVVTGLATHIAHEIVIEINITPGGWCMA
jgi:hypothetical protein